MDSGYSDEILVLFMAIMTTSYPYEDQRIAAFFSVWKKSRRELIYLRVFEINQGRNQHTSGEKDW